MPTHRLNSGLPGLRFPSEISAGRTMSGKTVIS
jgi:hypothetical protein